MMSNMILLLQHLRLFLDNSEVGEVQQFFDAYYSHVYYIVYEHFIATEQSLRQKGAHKASSLMSYPVLRNRIRIRKIHMFWGFPDPNPEIRIRLRILLLIKQNSKKNIDSYGFVASL